MLASSQQQMGSGVPGLPIVCLHIRRRTCKTFPCESTLYSWQEFCFPICAFATVKMTELKVTGIKAGSKSKFEKLRRAGREEVEREGMATKTSATTSMWVILQELVGRAKAGFGRKLSAQNKTFNKKAILKLVHIESECYPPYHYQKQGRLRWVIGFHCSYKWVSSKPRSYRSLPPSPNRDAWLKHELKQRKGKTIQTGSIKENGLFGGLSKRE